MTSKSWLQGAGLAGPQVLLGPWTWVRNGNTHSSKKFRFNPRFLRRLRLFPGWFETVTSLTTPLDHSSNPFNELERHKSSPVIWSPFKKNICLFSTA